MSEPKIVTLEEMKAELGIEDARDDVVLQQWLVGLEARISNHCRRDFVRQEDGAEIINGGNTYLMLKRWPVESITSVHVSPDQEWDADSLLAADDYRIDYIRGKLVYGSGGIPWPAGFQNIRVVYTGGFVPADETPGAGESAMPEELRRAVFMQAGFEWRNRQDLGKTQIGADGASVQFGAGVALALKGRTLMPEVRSTLQPLRRFV